MSSPVAALIRGLCQSSGQSLRRIPEGSALFHSLQSGRLGHDFRNAQPIGQGGFGTVLKAESNVDDRCYGLKLIPVKLRNEERIENTLQNWSGKMIFEKLQRCDSPYVLRYFDFWGEEPSVEMLPNEDADCVVEEGQRSSRKSLRWDMPASSCQQSMVVSEQGLPDGFSWVGLTDSESKCESDSLQRQRSDEHGPDDRHDVVLVVQLEFCAGVQLSSWLQEPGLRDALSRRSLDGALALFRQLLWALRALHSRGVVHRDLKPDNLFVAPYGCIKLFDFGLAQLQSPKGKTSVQLQSPKSIPATSCQDGAFTAVGTPGYAPPENCNQKPSGTDSSADVYSAGVILMELLLAAVKGPAWSTSMERMKGLEAIRGSRLARPVLPEDLCTSTVPEWLKYLVTDMVLPHACHRPQVSEALEQLYAGTSAMHRHNPYVGTRLTPLAPAYTGLWGFPSNFPTLSVRRCPYIGFFMHHGSSVSPQMA